MASNPFDFTEMFKAFDPDKMTKMWDPQAMMRMFQQPQAQMFDMEQVIRANQRNFDAMAEANKSAAEAYKDLLDKQMEIFEKMTHAARQQYEWVEDNAGPDTMKAPHRIAERGRRRGVGADAQDGRKRPRGERAGL